jgi:plasmid stabilization system protein ParE
MNYSIRPEAEGDYLEALVYYGTRSAEAALRFEAEFISLADRIYERPQMYRVKYPPDIRQAPMGRRFPYSIYFREIEGGIEIVAISHHSRQQGYWLDRL